MADPITIGTAVITGLVGAYKAYADYKAAAAKAAAEQQPAPPQDAEAARGAQVAPQITAAVQQHGDDKDRAALAMFADEPDTYQTALEKKLADLARRSPAFAQQLQALAQQANIPTGGVQGSVNVSGQGRVYGPATGVNTGAMTYNAHDER